MFPRAGVHSKMDAGMDEGDLLQQTLLCTC
jgi:hypothetical protein